MRVRQWGMSVWDYCSRGVWSDTRSSLIISIIKTLNLSVSSFLNSELQSRAAALTYKTLLAIVPALALIFAIARGFGFQNILQNQLLESFPSLHGTLKLIFGFADSYLSHASEGVFVGVGIIFLLWTLITLLSNIELSFNTVWGIKRGRRFWRKLTDYTAILLILPIIIICAFGLQMFLSESVQSAITFEFLSPVYPILLDFAIFVLSWLFFAGMYMLVPNTKVRFKHAFVAGVVSGTAFQILRWVFVSGMVSVTKYNAIYGSFSFLPLLLLWIYFIWIVALSGAVLCYSSQNIIRFNYFNDIKEISVNYRRKVSIAIMVVIAKQFHQQRTPLTLSDLSEKYDMPVRLVTEIVNDLIDSGLVSRVFISDDEAEYGLQPAVDVQSLTLGFMLQKMDCSGSSSFVAEFDERFPAVFNIDDSVFEKMNHEADKILLVDIDAKLED